MRPRKKPRKTGEYDAELIRAVRTGDADWVELLLEEGADPNARDERGDPVLYSVGPTASAGFTFGEVDARILQALLKAGADPELDEVAVRMCRSAWRAVCSAAEAGDARRLQELLGISDNACKS